MSRIVAVVAGLALGIAIGSAFKPSSVQVNYFLDENPTLEFDTSEVPTAAQTAPQFVYSFTEHDVKCLAENIFGEARNLNVNGQLWVAAVTINRALDPRFPHTVCGVVRQHKAFSWRLAWNQQIRPFKNKKIRREKITVGTKLINARAMQKAEDVARFALSHQDMLPNKEVLFYHSVAVNPKWAKQKLLVKVVDNQAFYAWP